MRSWGDFVMRQIFVLMVFVAFGNKNNAFHKIWWLALAMTFLHLPLLPLMMMWFQTWIVTLNIRALKTIVVYGIHAFLKYRQRYFFQNSHWSKTLFYCPKIQFRSISKPSADSETFCWALRQRSSELRDSEIVRHFKTLRHWDTEILRRKISLKKYILKNFNE